MNQKANTRKTRPPFPLPVKFGASATRWRLSDLLAYEAEVRGEEHESAEHQDNRYLSAEQVAERYSVSRASIWRWTAQADRRGRAVA